MKSAMAEQWGRGVENKRESKHIEHRAQEMW